MTTIKDVASRAGVSIGTASNVLNGVLTVNRITRQRVLKAVKELNYRPNRIARGLISGYTQTLAFIIPDISNPFFPELVRGATIKASAFNYSLFLANIVESSREIEYIRDFISQGIDGLIIATSEYSEYSREEVEELGALDIPIVMVDRDLKGLERDLVILDNIQCAETLMNHLLNLGRKHIGIIVGPLHTLTASERLEGAKRALEKKGLFNNTLVRTGGFNLESGYQMMQGFIKDRISLDAVFCANDVMAIGAMKAIEQAGYRVPEDIAVAGFDDLSFSSLVKPPLTTIRQPIHEMGEIAVSLLMERIQGRFTGLPRKVVLPGELVVRESTATNIVKTHQ
jgi:LacI family transcriptional regulator